MYKFRVTYKIDGKFHRKIVYANTPTEIFNQIMALHPGVDIEVTSVNMAN